MGSFTAGIEFRRREVAFVGPTLAVFLLALAIRVATPVALPTTDEATTLAFVRQYDTMELLWSIPTMQPHFPAYYVLLDLWGMAFPLESSRYISVVAGSLVPVVAVLWFRKFMDVPRAILSGLLLAFSPPLIVQSHWLRMYALLTLAVLVSWWAAWSYLQGEHSAWQYALAAGAALSLHPLGVAAVGAQLVWLGIEQYKTSFQRGFFVAVGALGLLSAALLTPLAARVLGVVGGYSIGHTDLHIRYAATPIARAVVLPLATVAGTAITWVSLAALAGVTLMTVGLIYRRRLWATQTGRLALCWILASMVLFYIGHAVRPVILLKYVCWLAPGAVLILGLLSDKPDGKAPVAGLMGVYVPNLVFGLLFGAHVAMVAIWESGVVTPGAL